MKDVEMVEPKFSGARLRKARMSQGRGLRDVGREAGVDAGQLSRIERGLEQPSTRTLLRLARALNLRDLLKSLGSFYDESESSPGGDRRADAAMSAGEHKSSTARRQARQSAKAERRRQKELARKVAGS